MRVISTNIGEPTKIFWNGSHTNTGIFKYPVDTAINLDFEHVTNDTIADRRVHGGIHKACYLFSADQYPYWKKKYPHLNWDWGMFGENLTVEGLDEATLRIGNIYKLGSTLVQVSQPREPCYKLGIRFENQGILKEFIAHEHPGAYLRLLETGLVQKGDVLELIEESNNALTIQQYFHLLYAKVKDPLILALAIENEALPEYKRLRLRRYVKQNNT
jgi:MOSC domain-containing protein YiiM